MINKNPELNHEFENKDGLNNILTDQELLSLENRINELVSKTEYLTNSFCNNENVFIDKLQELKICNGNFYLF